MRSSYLIIIAGPGISHVVLVRVGVPGQEGSSDGGQEEEEEESRVHVGVTCEVMTED